MGANICVFVLSIVYHASNPFVTKEIATPVEDNDSDTTTQATDDTLPLLDRNTYKSIKKMGMETLEGLIQDNYESGRQKGRSEMGSDDEIVISPDDHNAWDRELAASIKNVKGVGENRAEETMRIIEAWHDVN